MVAGTGIEYIQGDCVHRVQYIAEDIPGDNKADDPIRRFLQHCLISLCGPVTEKERKDTAAVKRRKWNKIKYKQDKVEREQDAHEDGEAVCETRVRGGDMVEADLVGDLKEAKQDSNTDYQSGEENKDEVGGGACQRH